MRSDSRMLNKECRVCLNIDFLPVEIIHARRRPIRIAKRVDRINDLRELGVQVCVRQDLKVDPGRELTY
jgi:hypothetical protein